MTTEYAYIQTPGARLGWVKSALAAADVDVAGVKRAGDGSYMIAIQPYELERAKAALEPITNYERKPKQQRKAFDLRVMNVLLLVGVAVAGLVALVTPIGGVVVLAWLGVSRLIGSRLHENAAIMHQAGGRYRLYAVIGMALMLLLVAGFIAAAGGMAVMEIADGNSALKLLQVQP